MKPAQICLQISQLKRLLLILVSDFQMRLPRFPSEDSFSEVDRFQSNKAFDLKRPEVSKAVDDRLSFHLCSICAITGVNCCIGIIP